MDLWGFAFEGGSPSVQADALPFINSGGSGVNLVQFGPLLIGDYLREIGNGPLVRVAYGGNSGLHLRLERGDDDAPNAQPGNGVIDAAYTLNAAVAVDEYNLGTSVGGQVLVAGPGFVTSSGYGFAAGTTLAPTSSPGGATFY